MQGIRSSGPDISIDDLAVAAGVSKPVLYDEFGGKLGIADAIAVVLAEDLEQQVLSQISLDDLDIERATQDVIEGVIEALIDVIVAEPELYAFVVRSIRTSDRGFLDNALVRVVHQRATLLVGLVARNAPSAMVDVLTDGLFGFVFASVESWYPSRQPHKDDLVRALTIVIREGIRAVAEDLSE